MSIFKSFYKSSNSDEYSFETLIKKEQDKLYKVAYSYVKNEQDALDIVQDAIIKGFKSFDRLKEIVTSLFTDGTIHLDHYSRRGSNSSYDLDSPELMINEKVEIPRKSNSYIYKIVPYIITFKGGKIVDNGYGYIGKEITSPLQQGAILETDSTYNVVEIKDKPDGTIVYYEMDAILPIFPTIVDRSNDIEYQAISYKQQDGLLEVTYPKVKDPQSSQLLMYDATYEVFSDLEVEIDLK